MTYQRVAGLLLCLLCTFGLACGTSARRSGRLARGNQVTSPPTATSSTTHVAKPEQPRSPSFSEEVGTTTAEPTRPVVVEEARLVFTAVMPGDRAFANVDLGARIMRPAEGRGPGIVIVPGAGDVSRDGTRRGDGVVTYRTPIDVARLWAESFASRGAVVLSWDKRTCGTNDVAACTNNPQADVDALGPAALAKDVDEACALLRKHPAFDGRLVLFAHGQAGQVALTSRCAQEAAALVLLSPIPRAIDEVLVDALDERRLEEEALAKAAKTPQEAARHTDEAARCKELAASRAASFASMRAGRFAADARVDGATISFWESWRTLTAATARLLAPVAGRTIVVVGGKDRQLGASDRARAKALPARKAIVIDDADHHLLVDEAHDQTVVEAVFTALDEVLPAGAT